MTTFSYSVRNLGLHTDFTLSLDTHIAHMHKSIHYNLNCFRIIRRSIPFPIAVTIASSYILTLFDYVNNILFNLPSYRLIKLQRLQNGVVRCVHYTLKVLVIETLSYILLFSKCSLFILFRMATFISYRRWFKIFNIYIYIYLKYFKNIIICIPEAITIFHIIDKGVEQVCFSILILHLFEFMFQVLPFRNLHIPQIK